MSLQDSIKQLRAWVHWVTVQPSLHPEDQQFFSVHITNILDALEEYEKALLLYADERFDWGYDHTHGAPNSIDCDYGEAAREALSGKKK